MRASPCPTCGNEPVAVRARWQQRQDLAITWLYTDPEDPGHGVARRHCAACQPHEHVATVVCPRCGDGPMFAGELAGQMPDDDTPPAAVRRWLAEQSWHEQPGTGLVCSDHPAGEGGTTPTRRIRGEPEALPGG